MTPEQRRLKILEILLKKRDTTVEDLANFFKLSIPSIYKDLQTLKDENKVQKIYGSIRIVEPEESFYIFKKRFRENENIKKALAKEAIKLIKDDDTIAIDNSTTTYHIITGLINENKKKITIITNEAMILREDQILKNKNLNIFIVGGIYERDNCCLVGVDPNCFFPNLKINKFFFSTFGISERFGVMDSYLPQQIAVKEYFFNNSLDSYWLGSSEKFKISGALNWVGYDKLKTIITDEFIEEEIIKSLRNKGVEVITVNT